MTDRDLDIEQLMLEKISGVIDADDLVRLDELIGNDREVRTRWEALQERCGRADGRFGAAEGLSRFHRSVASRKRRSRVMMLGAAVAASVLAMIVAGGVIYSRKGAESQAAAALSTEHGVKLYLGDKVVSLSTAVATEDTTDAKNVKLNIGKGSLSYVPLNGQDDHRLNTLVVPATMTYNIILSEGVEVWLNSESQLKFPFTFSADKREVWVSGEAYFKVTKDAHRPFVVHAPMYDVQVLGTEFNINTYDSLHGSTALVSGSVHAQSADGRNVVVKPGYQVMLGKGSEFEVSAFDVDSKLSWMKGIYYFQNAKLQEEIATAVRRWYGAKLVFDDPNMSDYRFSGALRKNRPLDEFLENLAVVSNISYTSGNGVIHLRPR